MTTSVTVTRSFFTKQYQTCKTKTKTKTTEYKTKTDFFGLRLVLSYDGRSQTTSLPAIHELTVETGARLAGRLQVQRLNLNHCVAAALLLL